MPGDIGLEETAYTYSEKEKILIDKKLASLQNKLKKKIVVIDDDPTGGQTVHGIIVYTNWSIETLKEALLDDRKMFYIMTNSRSMQEQKTEQVHKEIISNLIKAADITHKEFLIISRSDSTLRGHYPLETETIRNEFFTTNGSSIDGEVIIPFFKEGGRYTIDDIHYLSNADKLIPVGESEFANDRTFGFTNSDLKLWIEEKTKGKYTADHVKSVSLHMLRSLNFNEITNMLIELSDFDKLIVNATCYTDLKVFCISFLEAMSKGKSFIGRTAAAWPKILGGVDGDIILSRDELVKGEKKNGGLIMVGSHVNKTTEQLEQLRSEGHNIAFIEFNQHLALQPEALRDEVLSVASQARNFIKNGITVAVFTKRKRIDFGTQNGDDELIITNRISDAISDIVKNIDVVPKFIIVKGGITSSDIAVKSLNVKKAEILGQAYPGIPVWQLGDESKYPGIPYIIFPGNVGAPDTLKEIVNTLNKN